MHVVMVAAWLLCEVVPCLHSCLQAAGCSVPSKAPARALGCWVKVLCPAGCVHRSYGPGVVAGSASKAYSPASPLSVVCLC